MEIKSAKFIKSAVETSGFLDQNLPEIAFVGRSNVGKSSLLNSLTKTKNLAKTSKTPGRTRMINYFMINDKLIFVDLPGYGFHQAGKEFEQKWSILIEEYLLNSQNLSLVIVLLDIRHTPSIQDQIMIDFLYKNQLPFIIIATKTDKIARSKINNYLKQMSKTIKIPIANIFPHSSQTNIGRNEILEYIEKFTQRTTFE